MTARYAKSARFKNEKSMLQVELLKVQLQKEAAALLFFPLYQLSEPI